MKVGLCFLPRKMKVCIVYACKNSKFAYWINFELPGMVGRIKFAESRQDTGKALIESEERRISSINIPAKRDTWVA